MRCTGAGRSSGNIRRLYRTYFNPGISPWKRINSILIPRLRWVWRAWKPLFWLTVPGCVQFSAHY